MKTFTIGRDAKNSIVLNDKFISRQHAELVMLDNGQILLKDLNSSNGTYVNGNKVTECYLKPGDIVKCGTAFLNWSQYVNTVGGRVGDIQNHQPYVEPAVKQLNENYSLGTTIKYLTSRILDAGELFKSDWNKNSTILVLLFTPVAIALLGILFMPIDKTELSFSHSLLALLAVFSMYGIAQFLSFALLSVGRNTDFKKNLLAASIFSLFEFLLFPICSSFIGLFVFLLVGELALIYLFLAIVVVTLAVAILASMLVFNYNFFRAIGVSKSVNINYTIFSLGICSIIQFGLINFVTPIADLTDFNSIPNLLLHSLYK